MSNFSKHCFCYYHSVCYYCFCLLGEAVLTEDTVESILSAAHLFQLLPLVNGCANYMLELINTSNCIGIYFFSKTHQCESLAAKAKELINNQFMQLSQEKDFLELPSDQLIEILKDNDLCVTSEVAVYEACMAWFYHDLETRQKDLINIMRHVRLAIVDCFYFCDNIDSNELLQNDVEMLQMLLKCKYYHMLKNRVAEIDLNLLPRKGMNYSRHIVLVANPHSQAPTAEKCISMEMLDLKKREIKSLCSLPRGVYMPGIDY